MKVLCLSVVVCAALLVAAGAAPRVNAAADASSALISAPIVPQVTAPAEPAQQTPAASQSPDAAQPSEKTVSPPSSTSYSPLTAMTLSGVPVDLLKEPGWRVIYFWSAECPCVKACENFSLKPLAIKYSGRVKFYAIVSGKYDLDKTPAELSKDIAEHKLPYPALLDTNHTVAKTLNAEVTPEVYLIDPHNRIRYSGMPDDSKRFLLDTGDYGITKSYLARAMAQALAGKTVTLPRTENEGCSIAW